MNNHLTETMYELFARWRADEGRMQTSEILVETAYEAGFLAAINWVCERIDVNKDEL